MSRLEELIQQLCPTGVEYTEINTFNKVLRCKRLTNLLPKLWARRQRLYNNYHCSANCISCHEGT